MRVCAGEVPFVRFLRRGEYPMKSSTLIAGLTIFAAAVTAGQAAAMGSLVASAPAVHTAAHARHRAHARRHSRHVIRHVTLQATQVSPASSPIAPLPKPGPGRPARPRATLPNLVNGERHVPGFKAGSRDAHVAAALGL